MPALSANEGLNGQQGVEKYVLYDQSERCGSNLLHQGTFPFEVFVDCEGRAHISGGGVH